MRRPLALLITATLGACAAPKTPSVVEPQGATHAGCEEAPTTTVATPAPTSAVTDVVPSAAPLDPELPPAALMLGDASAAPAVTPSVRIESPASNAHVAADASVTLNVSNWATAEGAAHVHLILDNQPYKPIYNTAAPVALRDLNGGKDLSPGPHVLVAFASRANHESVKQASALAVTAFVVGTTPATAEAPKSFLIYSRPKGTYAGPQANHVLVDFQLAGVSLGEKGSSVAIEVRGEKLATPLRARATQFGRPYYLENLPSGTYELELQLLDVNAKPVDGAWNKTLRTIVIDRTKKP